MTAPPASPARTATALIALAALAALVAMDIVRSGTVDPFDAPVPIALGSGQAPSGAHCTDL